MKEAGRLLQLPSAIETGRGDRIRRFESVVREFLRETRAGNGEIDGPAEKVVSQIVTSFGSLPFPFAWPVEILGFDWDHPKIRAAHRFVAGAALAVAVSERPELEQELATPPELITWAEGALRAGIGRADSEWMGASLRVQEKFVKAERSGSLIAPRTLRTGERFTRMESVVAAKKSACLIAALSCLARLGGFHGKEALRGLVPLYYLVQLLDDLHDTRIDLRTQDHNIVLDLLVVLALNEGEKTDLCEAVDFQVRAAEGKIFQACEALPSGPARLTMSFGRMIGSEIRRYCRNGPHLRDRQLRFLALARVAEMRPRHFS